MNVDIHVDEFIIGGKEQTKVERSYVPRKRKPLQQFNLLGMERQKECMP